MSSSLRPNFRLRGVSSLNEKTSITGRSRIENKKFKTCTKYRVNFDFDKLSPELRLPSPAEGTSRVARQFIFCLIQCCHAICAEGGIKDPAQKKQETVWTVRDPCPRKSPFCSPRLVPLTYPHFMGVCSLFGVMLIRDEKRQQNEDKPEGAGFQKSSAPGAF